MKLFDQVQNICKRLSNSGWAQLFKQHGLDILSNDLEKDLLKSIKVDRTQPGFEDFALLGKQAIEPYKPAESLLFHALASPQVVSWRDEKGIEYELTDFATLEEICIVEDYVYAVKPPSLQELRVKVGNSPLAIVVFASEYRSAINTVHQNHADKCYSRVGISRVGTFNSEYLGKARGFLPFVSENEYGIRVIPCYYSSYISVYLNGDPDNFGPMRFQNEKKKFTSIGGNITELHSTSDKERGFWVPIHKLFAGEECIRDFEINPKISARHINEKLRKVHKALAAEGYDTGFHEPDISNAPFTFTEGIANLTIFSGGGSGLIEPIPHKSVVERAEYNGKVLTYRTPKNKEPFHSSVNIQAKKNGARSASEYVHARHKFENGKVINLNEYENVNKAVREGDYNAIHYVDYTGDGCILIECPELSLHLSDMYPAYSMISAVDFFPLVKQSDLVNWWNQSVPEQISNFIWPNNPGPPLSLCDVRYPANLFLTTWKLSLPKSSNTVFKATDNTISTIVGGYKSCKGELAQINKSKSERISTLPDGASGIFAPGWDLSLDRTEEIDPSDDGSIVLPGTTFFNNYGLGSPFPEDAMLCAALSSFWPAAAPDITRSFFPDGKYATATPLTDEVIGQGDGESWNGIPAPKVHSDGLIEYYQLDYGDFVEAALKNKFNYSKIANITAEEYIARTLTMAKVYLALEASTTMEKSQWVVFSFTKATSLNNLKKAEIETGLKLNQNYSYIFKIFKYQKTDKVHSDFRKKFAKYDEMLTFYADPQTVIKVEDNGFITFRN
jgi:hypothetical protein